MLEHAALDAGRDLPLVAVQDVLKHVVNERAMAYGLGESFKRKLTRYHGYAFLSSLTPRPVRNAFSFACPCSIGPETPMRCAPTIIPILDHDRADTGGRQEKKSGPYYGRLKRVAGE